MFSLELLAQSLIAGLVIGVIYALMALGITFIYSIAKMINWAMGAHPVIWINPRTKGRVVYSALGHTPGSYDDPNYRRILANAIRWAAR